MAYLKPPWFTVKVFNRIAMATGISNTETLTITKRGSKEPQHIPVVTVDVDGTRYLVSTRGESQWVQNVRANPTAGRWHRLERRPLLLDRVVACQRCKDIGVGAADRIDPLTGPRGRCGAHRSGHAHACCW